MSLVRKSSNCSRPGELLARLPCGHTFHKEFGAEQWSGNERETSCSRVFIPKVCNRYVPISQVDCPNFKYLISRLQGMQVKLTKVFIPQSKKGWFLKKNTENHSEIHLVSGKIYRTHVFYRKTHGSNGVFSSLLKNAAAEVCESMAATALTLVLPIWTFQFLASSYWSDFPFDTRFIVV